MKKLFALTAIFALFFAGCDKETDPDPETTLIINNLSDYDLFGVSYSSIDFGAINSGDNFTREVNAGTGYIYFFCHTVYDNVRCRTEAFTCEEDKKNEISINNNTIITTTADEQRDTLKSLFTMLNRAGKLKIKNESFTEITDVRWQNVYFANTSFENSLKSGTGVTNAVPAGAGYIFFKRKSNPVTARTGDLIIVENDEDAEFTFSDDTPIVEANNTANNGTLGDLQSTVIWFDDAEGEVQPYTLRQSFVGYYADESDLLNQKGNNYFYPPKNGNKSIAVGGTSTALLQLKINLERNAKLSFWYANKLGGTIGTIFKINDEEKTQWVVNVDWSFLTFDLEAGENDLRWEKKDGYSSSYYYLSLDDILIYYTE